MGAGDGAAAMGFPDRIAAGRALAERLVPVVSATSVVAGIPCGGIAVALPIVQRLHLPLAVVYARKLSAPAAPEVAFGALDEDGVVITEPGTMAALGLGPADVEAARARVAAEIRRRIARYGVPPLGRLLPGREIVLVDDGLATGLTLRAAVAYVRRHGATRVTVAVPCAAAAAAARFRLEADGLVALVVDQDFAAVGAYYEDFSPVGDEEVIAMLARARGIAPRGGPPGAGLRLSFKNSRGLRLAGNLLLPEGDSPSPAVLFAHGWGSGKDSPPNRAIAEALREAGLAAFLLDFTGHGDSEGAEQAATLDQEIDDLRAAMDVLESLDEIDAGRIGVTGTGSGAAVALAAAAADARVGALVLRSGDPAGAEAVLARVRAPTLLVVGEHDAPIRAAAGPLLARLGGPAELAVVAGAGHLFHDPAALAEAAARTVTWFRRHLG